MHHLNRSTSLPGRLRLPAGNRAVGRATAVTRSPSRSRTLARVQVEKWQTRSGYSTNCPHAAGGETTRSIRIPRNPPGMGGSGSQRGSHARPRPTRGDGARQGGRVRLVYWRRHVANATITDAPAWSMAPVFLFLSSCGRSGQGHLAEPGSLLRRSTIRQIQRPDRQRAICLRTIRPALSRDPAGCRRWSELTRRARITPWCGDHDRSPTYEQDVHYALFGEESVDDRHRVDLRSVANFVGGVSIEYLGGAGVGQPRERQDQRGVRALCETTAESRGYIASHGGRTRKRAWTVVFRS